MKILLIDNEDSFTFNLAHQLVRVAGSYPEIIPYTSFQYQSFPGYDLYVISAGPGAPEEYPMYSQLLDSGCALFGVCLGMQIINVHFGGSVARLGDVAHGVCRQTSYAGREISTAVYNSLYCDNVAGCLDVYAHSGEVPMALMHRELPVYGIQFHPESFMTENGDMVVNDALSRLGLLQSI